MASFDNIVKVVIDADTKGFDKGLKTSQQRLAAFAKKAAIASAAIAAAAAVGLAALTKNAMSAIDEQAKLAQSLGTTVLSIQNLERAGELAGVSVGSIAQATKDLTRRLSQAASGTGPAADALKRLKLTAGELAALPLDERVRAINDAIDEFIPSAEKAAVAGQLFGEEGSIAMARIDGATLDQAIADVRDFGVAVSEVDADKIEEANDAISRLGLITTGIGNALAVASAGGLKDFSDMLASVWITIRGPVTEAMTVMIGMIDEVAIFAGTAAVVFSGVWVASMVAAAGASFSLVGALTAIKVALLANPITAIAVLAAAAAVAVYKLSQKVGGLGNLFTMLADIFLAVFDGMGSVLASWGLRFSAFGMDIQAVWASMIAAMATKWAEFLEGVAPAFNKVADSLGLEGIDWFGAAAQASYLQNGVANLKTAAAGFRTEADAMAAGAWKPLGAAVKNFTLALADATTETEELTDNTIDLGENGAPAVDKVATSLGKVAAAGVDVKRVLTDVQDRAKTAAEMIGSKMEDAMMSMVDGTMSAKDAFKSMARSIIAELYRIFVVKKITGFITKAIGGAMGVPAAAMATPQATFEGGGYTGAGSRSGGVDGRGGFPAIIHPNETVIDHTRGRAAGGGGGGVTIIQNNTFGNGVNRAEISAMLPKIVEASKAAVLDARRRGGSYAGAF